MISPLLAPDTCSTIFCSGADKNLAIGDCHPSSVNLTQATPLAPKVAASGDRSSKSFRESSPPFGIQIPLTTPPFWMAAENTLAWEVSRASVKLLSSNPKRVSGLSEPYRDIASCQVKRRNGL